MSALDNASVAILVVAMNGCEHCEEYIPRLEKQVTNFRNYGHPFVFLEDPNVPTQPGQIPILVLDGESQDPGLVAFMDQWKITGMPTTILMTRSAGNGKKEGAINDAEIYELLKAATQANH